MNREIYYTFTIKDDGICYVDFPYTICESLNDISKYEYEKTYNKKFNEMSWYLDKGATELIKDVEYKYYNNIINMTDYYTFNFDFKDWVKDLYHDDALTECFKKNR